jgi:hypothetical protein
MVESVSHFEQRDVMDATNGSQHMRLDQIQELKAFLGRSI